MNAQTTLPSPRSAARAVLETAGIYAVAAALLVAGALVSPDFLTAENLLSILSGVALLGMVPLVWGSRRLMEAGAPVKAQDTERAIVR